MLNRFMEKAARMKQNRIDEREAFEHLAAMRSAVQSATGPLLTVDAYDKAEAEGTFDLSIPHMMAFRPVSYQMVGWPHKVWHQGELARYADHNFEAEISGLFQPDAVFDPVGYRNSFTHDENELLQGVRDKVRTLTENWYGRRIAPVSNILVQTGPFRMMDQIRAAYGKQALSVFEAGPGAGYLGALLSEAGHNYVSYDVAQSYYLWQSSLMQAVAGPDFVELAMVDSVADEVALKRSRVVHLPWWKFVSMLPGTGYSADVVYSNSNLAEMSQLSLRMLLHIARNMLRKSDIGAFTFFSMGMPAQTPHDQMDEQFRMFGFHKVFDTPFHAYVINPRNASRFATAFADGIPDYDPSGRGGTLSASEVTGLSRDEAPLDAQLAEWYLGWTPPYTD